MSVAFRCLWCNPAPAPLAGLPCRHAIEAATGKLARYEAALREIAKRPDGDPAGYIARKALGTW